MKVKNIDRRARDCYRRAKQVYRLVDHKRGHVDSDIAQAVKGLKPWELRYVASRMFRESKKWFRLLDGLERATERN